MQNVDCTCFVNETGKLDGLPVNAKATDLCAIAIGSWVKDIIPAWAVVLALRRYFTLASLDAEGEADGGSAEVCRSCVIKVATDAQYVMENGPFGDKTVHPLQPATWPRHECLGGLRACSRLRPLGRDRRPGTGRAVRLLRARAGGGQHAMTETHAAWFRGYSQTMRTGGRSALHRWRFRPARPHPGTEKAAHDRHVRVRPAHTEPDGQDRAALARVRCRHADRHCFELPRDYVAFLLREICGGIDAAGNASS
jgi:hypothetical protein